MSPPGNERIGGARRDLEKRSDSVILNQAILRFAQNDTSVEFVNRLPDPGSGVICDIVIAAKAGIHFWGAYLSIFLMDSRFRGNDDVRKMASIGK